MAELQDILSSTTINDLELDASYVPTEANDVMTKQVTEALITQLQAQIASSVVDGGTY